MTWPRCPPTACLIAPARWGPLLVDGWADSLVHWLTGREGGPRQVLNRSTGMAPKCTLGGTSSHGLPLLCSLPQPVRLNRYALDYWKHVNRRALSDANGLREGDAWQARAHLLHAACTAARATWTAGVPAGMHSAASFRCFVPLFSVYPCRFTDAASHPCHGSTRPLPRRPWPPSATCCGSSRWRWRRCCRKMLGTRWRVPGSLETAHWEEGWGLALQARP